MKRLLALALLVGSLFLVPMGTASADDCFSFPDLPGECLDQATFDYVVALKDDVLRERISANRYLDDATSLRAQMANMATDLQAARAETSMAESALAQATLGMAARDKTIVTQRATIKRLRDRLHAVI